MTTRLKSLNVLLAIVLVGLVALGVVLWRDRDGIDPEAPRAVARQAATNFFTISHESVDEDLEKVIALSTGEFKAEYAEESKALSKRVTDNQLTLTPTLVTDGTAIEYLSENDARVLVSVDLATTTPGGGEPDVSRYRSRITLVMVEDRWLVSGIDQVG